MVMFNAILSAMAVLTSLTVSGGQLAFTVKQPVLDWRADAQITNPRSTPDIAYLNSVHVLRETGMPNRLFGAKNPVYTIEKPDSDGILLQSTGAIRGGYGWAWKKAEVNGDLRLEPELTALPLRDLPTHAKLAKCLLMDGAPLNNHLLRAGPASAYSYVI